MKYNWKFKLDCVLKFKEGKRDFCPKGIDSHSFINHVRTWNKIFDDLGINGLKRRFSTRNWNKEKKLELVLKVMAGNSIRRVARLAYINSGLLYGWVNRYRIYGPEGLECKKGRKPPGTYMKKVRLNKSEKEELILLRERNKYLEAENLYLKKLRALELEKTVKLAKAKKQKSLRPSKKNLDAN